MKIAQLLAALCFCNFLQASDLISALREGNQLVIRAGSQEVLRYQAEPAELPRPEIPKPFIRGGYIQSIRTPSGRLITDDFPANHLHHHGVWSAWTKTEFEGRNPDFWNMGDVTGSVEFVALDSVWQKDGEAGFQARHRFIDLTAKPSISALLETWEVRVSKADGNFLIDITTTQLCAGPSPLKLPEYRYGGFGFRGSKEWNNRDKPGFLTASGLTDRDKVNTSREKWCWLGGLVDGETCGVTILCHPGNFRFPQPIRAHPDEPFFCYSPPQLGDMEIVPNQPYVSRYRLVIADGKPDAKTAEEWWQQYAKIR
ncbi:MAG: PmoA family protein [Gloeobacteraceae cyanobacterium ES-bin-144]|nr:PmoA family protein [Verrucomicrobiales bacterium]